MTPRSFFAWAVVALFGIVNGQAATAGSYINLLFDGDSISAGSGAWPPNRLDARVTEALGNNVRMRNVAVGGRPVHECLRLYRQLVAPVFDASTPYNIIVFHAGDNDIAAGLDALRTYAAFTAYVAAAHEQGWKVVVSTELRRWDFPPPMEAEILAYNAFLRENKAGADAVVDLDEDLRLRDRSFRSDPELFTHDGVHPSDGGYAVLAGLVAPVVKRLADR